jgi:hypothetical protein
MSRTTTESGLKKLAAGASRASAVALVVLGLAPAAAAAQEPQTARKSVGERIERVRNAFHERGSGALGPVAGALGTADQDPQPAPEPEPEPPDWNDWNDWADF